MNKNIICFMQPKTPTWKPRSAAELIAFRKKKSARQTHAKYPIKNWAK